MKRYACAALLSVAATGFVPSQVPAQEEEESQAKCPHSIAGYKGVRYRKTDHGNLCIYIGKPTGNPKKAAILMIHGGFNKKGSPINFKPAADIFRKDGYTVGLIDYRVINDGYSKEEANPATQVDDVDTSLIQFHDSIGLPYSKIALSGESAGGGLAASASLHAPKDKKPPALVLFNMAAGYDPDADFPPGSEKYAPIRLAKEGKHMSPSILFHHIGDPTVHVESVKKFCAKVKDNGDSIKLWLYTGHEHGFSGDDLDDAAAKANQFLQDRLGLDKELAAEQSADSNPSVYPCN